ncbi:unnamed protein product, partial [Phaeothamnion confervicola]
YCTGGVRCERASAYLRSKGDGFLDVRQLSGGIESYMAAFPAGSGGLFRGKNFVRSGDAEATATAAAGAATDAAAAAGAAAGTADFSAAADAGAAAAATAGAA